MKFLPKPQTACGHFSEDGLEYHVTTPHTPHRDWFNFLWNEHHLACAGPSLNGFSLYQSDAGVLTNLFGKQDDREPVRAFYLRDRADGALWSAGPQPCATKHDSYLCRHGLGYTILETTYRGIAAQVRVFVPRGMAGEIWSVKLVNQSRRTQRLDLFAAMTVALDGAQFPYGHLSGLSGGYQPQGGYLFFRNSTYTVAEEKYRAFFYSTRRPISWDTSREVFYGRGRNLARPPGVVSGRLANSPSGAEPMLAAVQHPVELRPGESWSIHYLTGVVDREPEVERIIGRYGSPAAIEKAFTAMTRHNRARLGRLAVRTPDADFNKLFSVWLKHQLYLMADWARFYFKGYRDTCQDAAGLSVLDAPRATALLHRALSHQRKNGYAPRAFRVSSPDVAAADKTYADSASWISHATDALLRETGDPALLDTPIPFADGGTGTVWEHNLRAVDFLWSQRGAHGLSLIRHGDWNDLMDKVGVAGRGEGVWMSCALARALRLVAEMAEWKGEPAVARRCRSRFATLKKAILKHGWDGQHFLYAINDDGLHIGTHRAKEGQVFLNPQTWALLSGVIDAKTYAAIMAGVEPVLDTEVGPLHHWPPFTHYQAGIGQLSGTPPGFFTNGNVYCHAAAFKIAADLQAGRAEKAFETLCRILPSSEKSEPYAQANGYVGPTAGRLVRGVSDDPWRTGTVAWNFLNVVDGLFGFGRTYDGVQFTPRLPAAWPGAYLERTFRGSLFRCEIVRGLESGVWVGGERLPGGFLKVPPGAALRRIVRVRCVITS